MSQQEASSPDGQGAGGKRRKHRPKKVRGIYEREPGSGVFWIQYFDAKGKRRREKAGTRVMAIKLLDKRRGEKLQRRKLPETMRRRPVLVSELLDAAAEHVKKRYHAQRLGADKKDYRYLPLKTALGDHQAQDLTPKTIEDALLQLMADRGWKSASFNRHKAFLSLAYRLGMENEKVTSNPVRLVHRLKESDGRIRWLTADEETQLRATIESDYPAELPAFDLALHTGMRRSEQYGLTWDCVDLERRQLTIPRSKNGEVRYIPLDNTARAALAELRNRGQGTGPVMVYAGSGHGHTAGHALKSPREWFNASCRKAGVDDFTWHCLRHTFASRLIMAGVGIRKVQDLMGHKTIAMTCRYAHLSPRHQLDAVMLLDGWSGKKQGQIATRTATEPLDGSVKPPEQYPKVTLQ